MGKNKNQPIGYWMKVKSTRRKKQIRWRTMNFKRVAHKTNYNCNNLNIFRLYTFVQSYSYYLYKFISGDVTQKYLGETKWECEL